MTQTPAALEVRNLRVGYGDKDILRDVTLVIGPGEVFGLLGPNGAGKTTLIRTICGRKQALAGQVKIAGRDPGSGAFRHLGLVPQEIALYPHLTIRENLEVFGRLSGLSKTVTRKAIADVSRAANLQDRLNERVDILSGGWKRRVNIAAAILHRPALLILDEPMVGVDLQARNGLHSVIQRLSALGMGILLVTHDLHQAEGLCTKIGLLHNGVIAPQGRPRDLLDAAFQGEGEIALELEDLPSAEQKDTLRQLGFSAQDGDLCWSMIGHRSPAELSAALERAELTPREIRFRKPDLETLFLKLSRDIGIRLRKDEA
ncbi:ABC transporter ATP-binding protein [Rhizobium sp. SSA_523]|uniref:ABC transporter ATP-binding protein n=1 Tax=Rhizobium sp. SSA_523 TaxID=2952477 RepID=UPI0020907A4B|nr:ABC transporter ATP-binding protein [Rhizobium sp. SSA_523]MCO5734747.1 ABC transporter ATP-binding protein [Rhizobium sp. SSA_523]WKC22986.1 ABC transporter ATP-binding protein [Rhizobium sp. SSA_523]